jgi:hypothetical protein
MATTTSNFGWAIPQSTDLVSQGATAIAALGSAIDTNVATVTLRDVAATSDTFVLADLKNKLIRYSSTSNVAVTIPLNSSVAFPTGAVINVIKTGATGTITIAGAGGVTVTSAALVSASPTITAQWKAATCIKVATDSWYVVGGIV